MVFVVRRCVVGGFDFGTSAAGLFVFYDCLLVCVDLCLLFDLLWLGVICGFSFCAWFDVLRWVLVLLRLVVCWFGGFEFEGWFCWVCVDGILETGCLKFAEGLV